MRNEMKMYLERLRYIFYFIKQPNELREFENTYGFKGFFRLWGRRNAMRYEKTYVPKPSQVHFYFIMYVPGTCFMK